MSKLLEELKDLYNGGLTREYKLQCYKDIEQVIKALEIIKEKKVDLEYLKCCETYEQYKTICSYWNEITKEEFDLLKEILL